MILCMCNDTVLMANFSPLPTKIQNFIAYLGNDGSLAYPQVQQTPILAPVALTGNYSDVKNTPALAKVATSGAYGDLGGSPYHMASERLVNLQQRCMCLW